MLHKHKISGWLRRRRNAQVCFDWTNIFCYSCPAISGPKVRGLWDTTQSIWRAGDNTRQGKILKPRDRLLCIRCCDFLWRVSRVELERQASRNQPIAKGMFDSAYSFRLRWLCSAGEIIFSSCRRCKRTRFLSGVSFSLLGPLRLFIPYESGSCVAFYCFRCEPLHGNLEKSLANLAVCSESLLIYNRFIPLLLAFFMTLAVCCIFIARRPGQADNNNKRSFGKLVCLPFRKTEITRRRCRRRALDSLCDKYESRS